MRTRLFLVSFALVVIGLAVAQLLLVPRLERSELEKAEDQLSRLARAASDALEVAGDGVTPQAVARRLSAKLGVRFTFIARDGRVLGDGEVTDGHLDSVESHRDRPEVAAALTGVLGIANRVSRTTGGAYLYVALPPGPARHGLITRAAMAIGEHQASIVRLRRSLVLAALVGLLVAGSLSTLAGGLVAGPLRQMTQLADAISQQKIGGRFDGSDTDEFGRLGAALNRMSQHLASSLQQLTRERDLLDAVLEGMSEGVLVTDGNERVVRANRALAAHLGITLANGPRALLEATRQPGIVDQVRKVRATRSPARREIMVAGPPERAFLVSSSPVADDSVVTVLLDVTDQRRLERVRQDFVANVSHELRTPIATLQAAAESLVDPRLPAAKHHELTAMVARNAERLGRLVSDLLELARLDSGELALQLAPLSIAAVARRVVDERKEAIAAKHLRLELAVPEELIVRGDARAVAQALANLVDNAIAYTPDAGTIGILGSANGATTRVTVWDTGPGVEPRHQARLFERFYRVDPGRSRELGGTGLGLAIVRHLIEAMGGSVGVEARSGGGSSFWVALPGEGNDDPPDQRG